jgi:hypothetical protein
MKTPNLRKKTILVILFLLFVPTIVDSGITAKTTDGIKYEIHVCSTTKKWLQTLTVTPEEATEINDTITTFLQHLNSVNNRKVALELYYRFIEKLDQFHLLGGLSVDQTYHLVTTSFRTYPLKRNNLDPHSLARSNLFCLLTGLTDETIFLGPIGSILLLLNGGDGNFLLFFDLFSFVNPLPVLSTIYLGNNQGSAQGTVWSFGAAGQRTWIGPFKGNFKYPVLCYSILNDEITWYPGVIGFTGIQIISKDWSTNFYFGSALLVNIKYTPWISFPPATCHQK